MRPSWEYTTLLFQARGFFLGGKIEPQALTDRLNELGREGWELVSIFSTAMGDGQTRDVLAVLKRPRE